MADYECIIAERHGQVGLIVLNRPAKLNAMNTRLGVEVVEALDEFERDDDIRAIVLTGAGDRAFSAGADMGEQVGRLNDSAPTARTARSSHYERIRDCPKPDLAAIRGYCYGGGANLAVNCDIRICGDDAKFRFVGVSYGLAPSGAMLPRIVGEAKAKEVLFTGDVIDAAEALRIGLANQVVPSAEVLDYTLAMAQRIAGNSPAAVRALKEVIDLSLPAEAALAREAEYNRLLRSTDDHGERFRAATQRVVGSGG